MSMGLTVTGLFVKEKPLLSLYSSMGNVIALLSAHIDQFYLKDWVDLAKLQAEYPGRVSVTNSMVSLKGPVAIIKSILIVKVALAAISGVATAFVLNKIVKKTIKCLVAKGKIVNETKCKQIAFRSVITISCIAAAAVFAFSSAILPVEPGVYFFGNYT